MKRLLLLLSLSLTTGCAAHRLTGEEQVGYCMMHAEEYESDQACRDEQYAKAHEKAGWRKFLNAVGKGLEAGGKGMAEGAQRANTDYICTPNPSLPGYAPTYYCQ